MNGMVNRCELLYKRRHAQRAKCAERLEPKRYAVKYAS